MSASANTKYTFLAFRNVCSIWKRPLKCTDRTILLMLDVVNTNE